MKRAAYSSEALEQLEAKLAADREAGRSPPQDLKRLAKLLALHDLGDLEIQFESSGNRLCVLEAVALAVRVGIPSPPWCVGPFREGIEAAIRIRGGSASAVELAKAFGLHSEKGQGSMFARRRKLLERYEAARWIAFSKSLGERKFSADWQAADLSRRGRHWARKCYGEFRPFFEREIPAATKRYRDRVIEQNRLGRLASRAWKTPEFRSIPQEEAVTLVLESDTMHDRKRQRVYAHVRELVKPYVRESEFLVWVQADRESGAELAVAVLPFEFLGPGLMSQ